MIRYIITFIVSFLLGGISFSYILGKMYDNSDIRTKGSKNAGATNAYRSYGKKIGILSLILDMLKAVIAVSVGKYLLGNDGAVFAMMVTVLSHMYSYMLNAKGGKGVAASAGALLVIDLRIFFILFLVFLLVFLFTRIVSLCSIISAITVMIVFPIICESSLFAVICIFITAIMVIIRHRSNIKRLLNGEEKKLFG